VRSSFPQIPQPCPVTTSGVSEAPQRLHNGPQKAHHRPHIAALEVAAREFAKQEKRVMA